VSQIPQHFAKACLFACIDDRLAHTHFQEIEEIGGAFCPALAGGGLAIVSQATRQAALTQVVLSYQINQITDVYLQSHTDCGAYRVAGAVFTSPQAEVERLYADLHEAKKLVNDALLEAGAKPGEVKIHMRVVDPAGRLVPARPLAGSAA
jgi:carbonic anhydrase